MTTANAQIDNANERLAARLGPATAALIADAFHETAFINHSTMAKLCSVSDKLLKQLGDEGRIKFHLKGKSHRIYPEREVIRVVESPGQLQLCQSTNIRILPSGNTTFAGRDNGFTARRVKPRSEKRKKSSM